MNLASCKKCKQLFSPRLVEGMHERYGNTRPYDKTLCFNCDSAEYLKGKIRSKAQITVSDLMQVSSCLLFDEETEKFPAMIIQGIIAKYGSCMGVQE